MRDRTTHPFVDRCEWYVYPMPGAGFAIRSMTFIGEKHDDDRYIALSIQDADAAYEIVNSHNAQPDVVKNKAHVLKGLED